MKTISPRTYQKLVIGALVAVCLIVVTGAGVRVTGSGLGCSDWPNCEPGSLVPRDANNTHSFIEFSNRIITAAVTIAVALAVLGAFLRAPKRKDLTLLSLSLVGGVIGQVILGGLSVLFELAPPFVMAHFLLSMILVAAAVVLSVRAGRHDRAVIVFADKRSKILARYLGLAAIVLLALGTAVTGAGPHGGDEEVERLNIPLDDIARVHSGAAWAFTALLLACAWRFRKCGLANAFRTALILLGVVAAQIAVGYTQYFLDVPAGLVLIHVALATALWVCVVWINTAVAGAATQPQTSAEPVLVGYH